MAKNILARAKMLKVNTRFHAGIDVQPVTPCSFSPKIIYVLLVFSVTPFKIDQNKNQNRPIDKVQNLGNKRRYIYKDPRQDSGQRNISYTRDPKKCFTLGGGGGG